MARTLMIIETGYRATLEEQDDPVVWIAHAMKSAGADLAVVLRGNAVNCAVKAQDASGLAFGDKKQTQPPALAEDLAKLVSTGVGVHIVEDDVAARGLERTELIDGLTPVPRSGLPKLFGQFERVWHW